MHRKLFSEATKLNDVCIFKFTSLVFFLIIGYLHLCFVTLPDCLLYIYTLRLPSVLCCAVDFQSFLSWFGLTDFAYQLPLGLLWYTWINVCLFLYELCPTTRPLGAQFHFIWHYVGYQWPGGCYDKSTIIASFEELFDVKIFVWQQADFIICEISKLNR